MQAMFSNGDPSFQDTKPGYLDIFFYSFFVTSDVMEEFFGFKSLTAERYPLLVSWTKALSEVPEVKDVTPSKSKLLELLYAMRQNQILPTKAKWVVLIMWELDTKLLYLVKLSIFVSLASCKTNWVHDPTALIMFFCPKLGFMCWLLMVKEVEL